MQQNVTDIQSMMKLFIQYFYQNFSPNLVIFIIYVIYCAVFICNYSFKGIILSFIGISLAYTCYLLIYDITYIQFLISLRLDESLRLIIVHYFPFFTYSKYAPSKAMPKFNNEQFAFLKTILSSSIISKESIKYVLRLQKKLLKICQIYILILTLPETKYNIKSVNTIVMNRDELINRLRK